MNLSKQKHSLHTFDKIPIYMTELEYNRKAPFIEKAEILHIKHVNTKEFLLAARDYIVDHANKKTKKYKPKSILESRFISADKAFDEGMLSCGAITNILASMLKHVGYKVKLIHGEIPKSVDHAWLAVYNSKNKKWEEFDLTNKSGNITPKHVKKLECQNWEEIRGQIEKDHKDYKKRITNGF
jgi:hypothetical protein